MKKHKVPAQPIWWVAKRGIFDIESFRSHLNTTAVSPSAWWKANPYLADTCIRIAFWMGTWSQTEDLPSVSHFDKESAKYKIVLETCLDLKLTVIGNDYQLLRVSSNCASSISFKSFGWTWTSLYLFSFELKTRENCLNDGRQTIVGFFRMLKIACVNMSVVKNAESSASGGILFESNDLKASLKHNSQV